MEIKEEVMELRENLPKTPMTCNNDMIPITISSSEDSYMANSDDEDSDIESSSSKRQRLESVLPLGFLDPLTPDERKSMQTLAVVKDEPITVAAPLMSMAAPPPFVRSCKQFWKAGDYEGSNGGASTSFTDGMDHLRVHPKFLHSNATSHKWALGAFAELLDNALDEVCHGATYVHVDMLENKKDNSKMLLVEDNGGGMTPDKMRQCMSLGYSEKSKMANTIGQYGNGFKTSTMRLGADVIVFSRCQGKDGKSATQSIGMLSYTFLTSTGKEDIVVPMIDYKKCGDTWSIMARASIDDWKRNLDSIVQWSPYENEEDLLRQFDFVDAHGTRIIIYNLWEDDQGSPELDFDTDPTDIQIRGVNRDDKKIEMANKYPNSRHFLTYRHSLRSYSSILYLRIPNGFRIILRKQDVEHHNIVNDMMNCKEITYRPTMAVGETPNNSNMVAVVSLGFVKDAKCHMDIQGFNVYHKNRLIKPFWRVWNAAGSDGRGVIGVLEANFVEPAHDKQGFERTIVLQRLESKLVIIQKNYWRSNCHLIGYAKRRGPSDSPLAVEGEAASTSSAAKDKSSVANVNNKSPHRPNSNSNPANSRSIRKFKCEPSASTGDTSGNEISIPHRETSLVSGPVVDKNSALNQIIDHTHIGKSGLEIIANLTKKNQELNESFQGVLNSLEYERDRNKSLENKLQEAQQAMEAMDKDQEIMITAVIDERERRNQEEASLKARLNDASETIQKLIQRVKQLENKPLVKCKIES